MIDATHQSGLRTVDTRLAGNDAVFTLDKASVRERAAVRHRNPCFEARVGNGVARCGVILCPGIEISEPVDVRCIARKRRVAVRIDWSCRLPLTDRHIDLSNGECFFSRHCLNVTHSEIRHRLLFVFSPAFLSPRDRRLGGSLQQSAPLLDKVSNQPKRAHTDERIDKVCAPIPAIPLRLEIAPINIVPFEVEMEKPSLALFIEQNVSEGF